MPVIPAIWEVEVVGLPSEVGPGKSTRIYLKNKLKQIGLSMWLKWYNACLARQVPEFNPQYCQKRKFQ
jgi:hypothetical protein